MYHCDPGNASVGTGFCYMQEVTHSGSTHLATLNEFVELATCATARQHVFQTVP